MILLRKKYSVSDSDVEAMQNEDYGEQAASLGEEMERASKAAATDKSTTN
jgi:hypothetical protein